MLSVGETLRRARLEQGLDLCAVAARTKINAKYLEAIESDDRKRLPSGFFYKSFVEQYAKSLALDTRDAREIQAEIDRVLSADDPLPLPGLESVLTRNVPPITFRRRFHPGRAFASTASLVLVLLGCSAVYAWVHDAQGMQGRVQVWVDNLRALAKPKTVAASAKPYKAAPKAIKKPAPPAENVVPPAAAIEALPVSLASDPKPDEVDESTIAAEATPTDYKVMLDLMAREATWLSVSSDGKPVFSGILQANQTKSVGGKQFAKLRIGNAAGIEVRLNGRLLAPLGARGQVLIVLFTPDNFQIVTTPKEGD
jgi:transcriptional regulator with XRE-family HTH domain